MPSIEALTKRILAQEGKSPDTPIKFHMTPFVPVKGIKGANIKFLIIGPFGPTEMLPPGIYVETDISPKRFDASPEVFVAKIEAHIATKIRGTQQASTGTGRNNRLRLANATLSPLGYLMFEVIVKVAERCTLD